MHATEQMDKNDVLRFCQYPLMTKWKQAEGKDQAGTEIMQEGFTAADQEKDPGKYQGLAEGWQESFAMGYTCRDNRQDLLKEAVE